MQFFGQCFCCARARDEDFKCKLAVFSVRFGRELSPRYRRVGNLIELGGDFRKIAAKRRKTLQLNRAQISLKSLLVYSSSGTIVREKFIPKSNRVKQSVWKCLGYSTQQGRTRKHFYEILYSLRVRRISINILKWRVAIRIQSKSTKTLVNISKMIGQFVRDAFSYFFPRFSLHLWCVMI